jgi:hypothetical protein
MPHPRVASLIVSLVLIGCAGNQQTDTASAGPETAAEAESASASQDPNTVTAEEIAATGAATAFEVVDRLHREWLRDKLTGQPVAVYQDNQRLGGEDALRGLPVRDVAELQYLDGRSAVMRWGPDVGGGVIIVVRNRS